MRTLKWLSILMIIYITEWSNICVNISNITEINQNYMLSADLFNIIYTLKQTLKVTLFVKQLN